MKRIMAMALVALVAVAVFAGCGKKEDKKVDLNAVMETINSENNFNLKKLETADDLLRYYGIEEADVKQFAAERDKNNEIVMVEAKNAASAKNVEAKLNEKLNSLVNYSTSYSPEKAEQVKACKVNVDGNFVSLFVTDNAEAVTKTYQKNIK